MKEKYNFLLIKNLMDQISFNQQNKIQFCYVG